jgi:hypothetical protein
MLMKPDQKYLDEEISKIEPNVYPVHIDSKLNPSQ